MSDPIQNYDTVSALYPNGSQNYRYRSMLRVDQNGAAIVSASSVWCSWIFVPRLVQREPHAL